MNLIVVESHFGNTVALAEAMAAARCTAGISTRVWMAHEAGSTVPEDVDILVVGAPSHDGELSTPRSRKRMAGIGAKDSTDTQGVREWLAAIELTTGVDLVFFDTIRRAEAMPRSAADHAVDLAQDAGFASASRGPSFSVEGVAGPLSAGELVRARRWATGGFAQDL